MKSLREVPTSYRIFVLTLFVMFLVVLTFGPQRPENTIPLTVAFFVISAGVILLYFLGSRYPGDGKWPFTWLGYHFSPAGQYAMVGFCISILLLVGGSYVRDHTSFILVSLCMSFVGFFVFVICGSQLLFLEFFPRMFWSSQDFVSRRWEP